MKADKLFKIPFSAVYPAYVKKAERKGRTREEVDGVIRWLTGYDQAGLARQIENTTSIETLVGEAPAMHPRRALITRMVCGVVDPKLSVANSCFLETAILGTLLDQTARKAPLESAPILFS